MAIDTSRYKSILVDKPKAFVVIGQSTDPTDNYCWPVCVYFEEAAAREHAARANCVAAGLPERIWDEGPDRRGAPSPNIYDPSQATHADYSVGVVPFFQKVPRG